MVDFPKVESNGTIKETTLGSGDKAFTIGGESAYPFHTFEGKMPHAPKLAMEVWDIAPSEWATELNVVFGDVYQDPVAWAKRCVELGADAVMLTLASTDPNGNNAPAAQAVETVKKVSKEIRSPLIVWGVENDAKDGETLRAVAEAIDDRPLVLGPVVEGNYKQVGAGAIGYKHFVVANSPIDINLAKQLNILLGNLGVKDQYVLMDPSVGGLGYGLEYTYSVMERARQAALTQGDDKLQFPLFCNVGKEVWKTKEAKTSEQQEPTWGVAKTRGIAMEAMTTVAFLLSGADLVVIRHPETLKTVRQYLAEMMQ
ncbi:MAG: acetyl-CoA decarbonylase/synthase complex subunit delta [Deltaproteobacteria bacterium]|nr:acetyl-CoA decarbonylase/synthase complex subunit delta [Deltaproteobacteria bacterium]